jgi:hypothetical protein
MGRWKAWKPYLCQVRLVCRMTRIYECQGDEKDSDFIMRFSSSSTSTENADGRPNDQMEPQIKEAEFLNIKIFESGSQINGSEVEYRVGHR